MALGHGFLLLSLLPATCSPEGGQHALSKTHIKSCLLPVRPAAAPLTLRAGTAPLGTASGARDPLDPDTACLSNLPPVQKPVPPPPVSFSLGYSFSSSKVSSALTSSGKPSQGTLAKAAPTPFTPSDQLSQAVIIYLLACLLICWPASSLPRLSAQRAVASSSESWQYLQSLTPSLAHSSVRIND